ncbi:hypothetical protein F2Q70_00004946 [Brassica cretica]|uniref:Uncharacterized protein n=1 Tax=Brassica cretica TaxID=69181 RepID=A0A8S9IL10_BRACR|nr:hypothetical protein F2Q70_00004946 [Brassica cretica]
MMNQSYPPDKSACNSPHPSSYSIISMPLEVATVQYKPFSTFVSAGPGDSKLMFRVIHFLEACNNSKGGILIGTKMVISPKDMIAYHEHAGEASNSHPLMLDAVSNEFWEQKIVRKSNGADIYRLQRNVKKRDRLESTGGKNIRDLRSILHWLRHGEED